MPIKFLVEADFYDHPKSLNMSDAAVALWTRAGSYSAAKSTDGFIAEHVLLTLSKTPQEAADELRRRGLWHKVRGGYRFHEWEEHGNLTKARIEGDRKADRERKRRGRPGHTNSAGTNGTQQVNTDIVRPESNRNPSGIHTESARIPPVSVSVSVSESVSGSGKEPPARCAEHLQTPNPPPCGQCKEARRTFEQWQADRRQRIDSAPRCPNPEHRGQLAHNCALCRSEQLALVGRTGAFRIVPSGAA